MTTPTYAACAACTAPMVIPLHRPVWQRWSEAAAEGVQRLSQAVRQALATRPVRHDDEPPLTLREAMALNDHTLRDIGVPESLREQVAAQRDFDAMRLRAARTDLGGGGLHWM